MILFSILVILLIVLLLRINLQRNKNQKPKHPIKQTRNKSRQSALMTWGFDDTEAKHNDQLQEREVPEVLKHFRLLSEDILTEKQKKQIVSITRKIPRPRSIFTALSQGISEPKELAQLVNSDPEIGAKILRVVNSSYFSLSSEITSIQHAVVYLGMSLVKDIAMQIAMHNMLDFSDPELEKIYHQLWIAGVMSSSISTRLATALRFPDPSSLSTQALLSSLGTLAIISNKPELAKVYSSETTLFERTKIEQDVLGVNSALVGTLLAREWELPGSIINGIKHSLLPMTLPAKECPIDKTALADTVLCYSCCRIGDLAAYRNLIDVADSQLLIREDIELFYLPQYIKKTQLDTMINYLENPIIRSKLNTMIRQIASKF